MTELLYLLKQGEAWSVEALAERLHTSPEDIRRKLEYLEHTGYLSREKACTGCCSGCSAHCKEGMSFTGLPVLWEVKK